MSVARVTACTAIPIASIVDYLRDYNDIRDAYSMTQRLEIDRDIDAMLKKVSDEGAAVGVGLRQTRMRLKSSAPNSEPIDLSIVYYVLASDDALPCSVRAPKQSEVQFI